jgi:NAD(P)-dependent dehydrogenase (short-subunit alcohol dehydrogenase family)
MRLKDKVAVVTGAGSGIGRATAELFVAEGAAVVASDWNARTLDEVVGALRASGGAIVAVQGNVALRADAEAMIDRAVADFGRLDVLVNNAGTMDYNHGVGSVPDEVWERLLAINLTGPMYTSRRAVQRMLASGGGAIVNVVSAAGNSGAVAGAAYTSTKHGLLGLTRNTAWMYARQGIRCNAILPGGVSTSIVSGTDPQQWDSAGTERVRTFLATMPTMLEPLDIARLALFLAGDESRHVNGAAVTADGGWLAT